MWGTSCSIERRPLEEESEDQRGRPRWQMPVPSLPPPAEILHGNGDYSAHKTSTDLSYVPGKGNTLADGENQGSLQQREAIRVCM